MPFKHNAARRHHIPPARYRGTNWPAYEAGLRRRGDLTFWVDEAALSGWQARIASPGMLPSADPMGLQTFSQYPARVARRMLAPNGNTVHFVIRTAALKLMRVVGCGVRGRKG